MRRCRDRCSVFAFLREAKVVLHHRRGEDGLGLRETVVLFVEKGDEEIVGGLEEVSFPSLILLGHPRRVGDAPGPTHGVWASTDSGGEDRQQGTGGGRETPSGCEKGDEK